MADDDSTQQASDSRPKLRFTVGGGQKSEADAQAPIVPVPDQAFGHTFTPQEKQLLQSGYVLYLPNLVSKKGTTYAADLILNRQTGRLEFFKGVPTHFHGVPLDEGQRGALTSGMVVYLPRLISKAGKPYEADIIWNPQEARLEFFKGVPTHFRGAPLSPKERKKLEAGYEINFKGLLDPDPYYMQHGGRPNQVYLRFDSQTGRLRNVGVPLEYMGIPLTYSKRVHLAVGGDATVSVPGKDGKTYDHVLAWDEKKGELFRRDFIGHVITDEEFQRLDAGESIYARLRRDEESDSFDADLVRNPETGRIEIAKGFPSHYQGNAISQYERALLEAGRTIRFHDAFIYWDAEKERIGQLTYQDMPDSFHGFKLTYHARVRLANAETVTIVEHFEDKVAGVSSDTKYEFWYTPDDGQLFCRIFTRDLGEQQYREIRSY